MKLMRIGETNKLDHIHTLKKIIINNYGCSVHTLALIHIDIFMKNYPLYAYNTSLRFNRCFPFCLIFVLAHFYGCHFMNNNDGYLFEFYFFSVATKKPVVDHNNCHVCLFVDPSNKIV